MGDEKCSNDGCIKTAIVHKIKQNKIKEHTFTELVPIKSIILLRSLPFPF